MKNILTDWTRLFVYFLFESLMIARFYRFKGTSLYRCQGARNHQVREQGQKDSLQVCGWWGCQRR
jgi:hypothetical protein